ncbi:MAG: Asp-tRNA(Asn)/Glu-tRNA(Gln) amidotransferase subunit GatA [Anaerolineae bacterium]
MSLHRLTIHQAHELLCQREVSAVELAESVLARIEECDQEIKAYITVTPEIALEQAARADERIAKGQAGPLTGIPVAIKDNMCTRGVRTSCGSRILENFSPPYTATAVQRLFDEGAVLVGKTNMDEFAMGSSTEHSGFFPTHNPWDPSRVPGGSSGGSAAAVVANETLFALGSDTGGSIRQPAAMCGAVGFKPTYGRVSRYGLIAFASSLDQIGPLTKDVTDCALVLNALAFHDPLDSTSASEPTPDYTSYLVENLAGVVVGVPTEYFAAGLDPGVETRVRQAIAQLEELGAQIREISMPHERYVVATYFLTSWSEASANLARYDGLKYGLSAPDARNIREAQSKARGRGFGTEVKRRIMLGTYALSSGYYDAYYLKAQKVRTLIKEDFDRAFSEGVDVIVGPTSPIVAFGLGEKVDDPLEMYLADLYTIPANLAGLPGISIPCGFHEGLPVGFQIMGRPFAEGTVLRVAHAYERSTDQHSRRPN